MKTPLFGFLRFDKHSRPAFSLIEVLVALTVVAILCVLVFTIHGSIKGKAQVAGSASNQRQITAAYLAYLMDHDNKLWYRSASMGWSGGSGPLFGAQDYKNAPGYLCVLLESYGIPRAKWDKWEEISNREQTLWYSPATYGLEAINGHGATYYYKFLGNYSGQGEGARVDAVGDWIASKPYLYDYYGNYEDNSKLYPGDKKVRSYLDGHTDYE